MIRFLKMILAFLVILMKSCDFKRGLGGSSSIRVEIVFGSLTVLFGSQSVEGFGGLRGYGCWWSSVLRG